MKMHLNMSASFCPGKMNERFSLFFRIQHDHMKKLAKIITPIHKDLAIPKIYHYECPWPAAQAEIFMINAYKVCAGIGYHMGYLSITVVALKH